MTEVKKILVLKDYLILLRFSDDSEKIIDFRPFIGKGITSELLDYKNFKKVKIEPGGGIAWDNGFDFCPNFLIELPSHNTKKMENSNRHIVKQKKRKKSTIV